MTHQSASQALENVDAKYFFPRIVVYKDDMLKAIVPRSAKPFNFQEAYKLSDETVSILITYVYFFK